MFAEGKVIRDPKRVVWDSPNRVAERLVGTDSTSCEIAFIAAEGAGDRRDDWRCIIVASNINDEDQYEDDEQQRLRRSTGNEAG